MGFSGEGSQITTQRSRSGRQKALGSMCAEPNGPAGRGMLEGKGSRLLYGRADVNGIIHIVAECEHPALRGLSSSLLQAAAQPDAELRLEASSLPLSRKTKQGIHAGWSVCGKRRIFVRLESKTTAGKSFWGEIRKKHMQMKKDMKTGFNKKLFP